MKTTVYNVVDSLRFAFGEKKWNEIFDEIWNLHHGTNFMQMPKLTRMNDIFEHSRLFSQMPYCTACLIIDCFVELYELDTTHDKSCIYGFPKNTSE